MFGSQIFAGRVALITGGSAGIGLAIAHRLAELGARTAIFGRDESRLEAAVGELTDRGYTAKGYSVDVRDSDAVRAGVEATCRDLGPVNLLVNNAAGNFRVDPLQLSTNGWLAVVNVVLNGTWYVTQEVGRRAIADDRALSVVNIGTSAATMGSATTVHSASAKSGVLTMTKSLAAAWATHGIRLNMLTPGLTEGTGGTEALYGTEEEMTRHVADIPLGRLARKEEIANACAYLLSDYAGYVTGSDLLIDGGRQLGVH